MNTPILQTTADGSSTLFVPDLNESYHSVNGAITESRHIFLDAGLHALNIPAESINVLEIGFGTGLNAFLTALESEKINTIIYYTGIELFPLSSDIVNQLNFNDEKGVFYKIHETSWEVYNKISDCFFLRKIEVDFTHFQPDEKYDLIYFDAFSPKVQPELWTESLFRKLFETMNVGGIITTYCAKGQVRRNMQQAGFRVERLPGPPGKREMLRGEKYPIAKKNW